MAIIARPMALVAASYASVAAHLFALLAAILVLVWAIHYGGGLSLHSDNEALVFNVHPVTMVLGFIIVTGEAIMVHRMVPAGRAVRKSVHMTLQLVGLALGIFGVYVAFKFHKESQIQDLYSLHSWLGIITICLFGLQWLSGFLYFWFPRAPPPTRIMHLLAHNLHRRERSRAERGDSGVRDRPHQLHRALHSPLRLRRLPLHCSAESARCVGFVGDWICMYNTLLLGGLGLEFVVFLSICFVCIIYSLNLFTPGFGG
ncbi:uncharacterized protein A4U43_C07F35990 [Asparagus officinalis]|uniref:Cytochrome b561 domain-containing protein n=1 Tax=Asparagus officinalis TaxID=4686 RepID=A0A5P1EHC1_ASPOF|nr:uncharacterized protein A4U43_C07F35990 [Asparagus officinalis]